MDRRPGRPVEISVSRRTHAAAYRASLDEAPVGVPPDLAALRSALAGDGARAWRSTRNGRTAAFCRCLAAASTPTRFERWPRAATSTKHTSGAPRGSGVVTKAWSRMTPFVDCGARLTPRFDVERR